MRGTRILVGIVLDALAGGLSEAEVQAEYPTLTVEGIRAAAAYGAELARDEYPAVATVRTKLDENLPASARPALADAGHDTDTAHAEGLDGADDPDVLAGAAADGRLLITPDRGLGDIRTYPPGTHGGVLGIRLEHQSPREIRRAVHLIAASVDLDGRVAHLVLHGPRRTETHWPRGAT